jgi:hypothetical protein
MSLPDTWRRNAPFVGLFLAMLVMSLAVVLAMASLVFFRH